MCWIHAGIVAVSWAKCQLKSHDLCAQGRRHMQKKCSLCKCWAWLKTLVLLPSSSTFRLLVPRINIVNVVVVDKGQLLSGRPHLVLRVKRGLKQIIWKIELFLGIWANKSFRSRCKSLTLIWRSVWLVVSKHSNRLQYSIINLFELEFVKQSKETLSRRLKIAEMVTQNHRLSWNWSVLWLLKPWCNILIQYKHERI